MKELIEKNGKVYLESEQKTGNQWYVAIVTGLDPKYKFTRKFLNKQRAGLSLDEVKDGDIIEEMTASHSGKNKSKSYFRITVNETQFEFTKMDERDVIFSFK